MMPGDSSGRSAAQPCIPQSFWLPPAERLSESCTGNAYPPQYPEDLVRPSGGIKMSLPLSWEITGITLLPFVGECANNTRSLDA